MKAFIVSLILCINALAWGDWRPSQALFTSRDNITEKLIELINQEQQCIRIATATLTSTPIQDALLRAKLRGIDIEIIVDKEWVDNNPTASRCIAQLEQQQIPVFKYKDNQRAFPAIMHNKFSCFYRTTTHRCCAVSTGSFNYTNQANINCENIIINYEPSIFDDYLIEFERIKKRILSQNDSVTKRTKVKKLPAFTQMRRTHHAMRHQFKNKKAGLPYAICTDLL